MEAMNRIVLTAFVSVLLLLSGCGKKPVLDEAATLFVQANEAIEAGETDKAIELLSQSLEERPDPWTYYERGRLYAEVGEDESASADIEAGLALDEEHSDLLWLQKQLKKPSRSRFKGKSGQPPRASK